MIYALIIAIALIAVITAGAALINFSTFKSEVGKPDETKFATADRRFVFWKNGRTAAATSSDVPRGALGCAVWNEHGERGIIVLAHGMGNSAVWYLPEIRAFADMGYAVFGFEYHGYAGGGNFFGFPRAVRDVVAAVDHISDGKRPVFLVGHSMGGYAVCAAAGRLRRQIAGVVAYAPFDRPDEAVEELTRNMKHPRLVAGVINAAQFLAYGTASRRSAAGELNRAGVPALIVQGSADDEVPPDGCAIYAHRERVKTPQVTFRFVETDGSNGHMSVVRRADKRTDTNPDTFPIVAEFIEKCGNMSH